MSRIIKQVLFLLIFSIIFIVGPIKVYAQSVPDCRNPIIQTAPDPLKDTDSNGAFIIDVDRTNKEQAAEAADKKIVAWKAEFECTPILKPQVVTSADPGGSNIRAVLNNGGNNKCAFTPIHSPISVLVKAVYDDNDNGTFDDGRDIDTPSCRAKYNVFESASFCQLDINPKTGITVNSNLSVTVIDVASSTSDTFHLYMDNTIIANNAQKGTSYPVPRDKMIEGSHTISLRRFLPITGPSICPIQLTIGTLSNPGTATPVGPSGPGGTAIGGGTAGPAATPCDGPTCSKAGGEPCGDSSNPGFKTAIGCIHTSPAVLVKDFMTFIVAISGGLAFLMMLLGSFQMLTSAGNPETLAAGKDRFTSAIIGLLFIIFAVLLMQIIGVGILNIPGFK